MNDLLKFTTVLMAFYTLFYCVGRSILFLTFWSFEISESINILSHVIAILLTLLFVHSINKIENDDNNTNIGGV